MSVYKVKEYDVEEIQAKIFEIFLEFDKICKRHNLSYTLEGGSLLGAVLHKSFIPWDDDMDIIMLRKIMISSARWPIKSFQNNLPS